MKIAKAMETLEAGATVEASPYVKSSGVGSLVAILGWLSTSYTITEERIEIVTGLLKW